MSLRLQREGILGTSSVVSTTSPQLVDRPFYISNNLTPVFLPKCLSAIIASHCQGLINLDGAVRLNESQGVETQRSDMPMGYVHGAKSVHETDLTFICAYSDSNSPYPFRSYRHKSVMISSSPYRHSVIQAGSYL